MRFFPSKIASKIAFFFPTMLPSSAETADTVKTKSKSSNAIISVVSNTKLQESGAVERERERRMQ